MKTKSKALFIPLKAEYFKAFERGEKNEEYRLYGPRWNEHTCEEGREVTLAYGYSKRRLNGVVTYFKMLYVSELPGAKQEAFYSCYGRHEALVAVIGIRIEPE